jgi:hypothetical protein
MMHRKGIEDSWLPIGKVVTAVAARLEGVQTMRQKDWPLGFAAAAAVVRLAKTWSRRDWLERSAGTLVVSVWPSVVALVAGQSCW